MISIVAMKFNSLITYLLLVSVLNLLAELQCLMDEKSIFKGQTTHGSCQ